MQQALLQTATASLLQKFITKCDDFITKCDSFIIKFVDAIDSPPTSEENLVFFSINETHQQI